MNRSLFAVCAAAALAFAAPAMAYDPGPWIEDLRQVRQALDTRYANLEWLTGEREMNLDAAFKAGEARLAKTADDAEARTMFDQMIKSLGDGHLGVDWTTENGLQTIQAAGSKPCEGVYDPAKRPPIAAALAGWRSVEGEGAREFATGVVDAGGMTIGVVRINLFMADPTTCQAAAQSLKLAMDKPCDEDCSRKLDRAVYQLLTELFKAQLVALKAAGAQVLLIDLTSNGGGREWAEVAARMVTAAPLKGARVGLVRSEATAKQFEDIAADALVYAKSAKGADKAELLRVAADLRAKAAQARTPCDAKSGCDLLIDAGYSTGVLAQADPATLQGKPWAGLLFQPAQIDHAVGVWSGPLIVLVDGKSASASEEFAAVLQDAKAAVILGAPTHGSGCGHATPAGPVVLKNSGARLSLPDCARLRADGSNEINGVDPDVLIGFRALDSAARKAKRLEDKLPEAVAKAAALKAP